MLIGIDGNEANEVRADLGAPAGVNVYAFELLRAIYKLQDNWKNEHKVVVYLKRPPNLLPPETEHFKYKILGPSRFWVLTKLTPYLYMTGDKPNVVFSPSHYVPFLAPMPKFASIMDLGYLKFSGHLKKSDYWQLKWWTAMTLRVCRYVFAISESTQKDIVRHYPFMKGKVVVTPLAYDPKKFTPSLKKTNNKKIEAVKSTYSIGRDYVLYLGVLKPSKNIEGLVKAWASVVREYPQYCLVIAGKKGWMFESIFEIVKKLKLEQSIIFTDYIKEEDKSFLIAGSKLFVLPSFWEGFGLDVLNAMAIGIPVTVSDVGSLPEVAGDAGIYFNPNSPQDISQKIRRVLSLSNSGYNKLAKMVLAQSQKYSWENTAVKTLKVLTQK